MGQSGGWMDSSVFQPWPRGRCKCRTQNREQWSATAISHCICFYLWYLFSSYRGIKANICQSRKWVKGQRRGKMNPIPLNTEHLNTQWGLRAMPECLQLNSSSIIVILDRLMPACSLGSQRKSKKGTRQANCYYQKHAKHAKHPSCSLVWGLSFLENPRVKVPVKKSNPLDDWAWKSFRY